MAAPKLASVPLQPLPLPESVLRDGLRLDGRGFEELRPICELAVCWLAGEGRAAFEANAKRRHQCAAAPARRRARLPKNRLAPHHTLVTNVHAVASAQGSAYVEMGETKVMAAA